MNIEEIIKKGEGLTIDFKEEYTKNIARVVASFASCFGGLVIIGIDKFDNVIGVDKSKIDNLKASIDSLVQNVHPRCFCEYTEGKIGEKSLLLIKVDKGTRSLYFYDDRPYIRQGTISRPAKPEEVDEIVINYYYAQGLKAVLTELKMIHKILHKKMPILELPLNAWFRLMQMVPSEGQGNMIERLSDTYGTIMVWNNHGKIISNQIQIDELNIARIMDGPIGKFCGQREMNLALIVENMVTEIENYLNIAGDKNV